MKIQIKDYMDCIIPPQYTFYNGKNIQIKDYIIPLENILFIEKEENIRKYVKGSKAPANILTKKEDIETKTDYIIKIYLKNSDDHITICFDTEEEMNNEFNKLI